MRKKDGEQLWNEISVDLFMGSLIAWLNRHHDEFLAENIGKYDTGYDGDPFHEVIEHGSFVYGEHQPHTRDWLNCMISLFTDLPEEEKENIDEHYCSPDIGVVASNDWAVIRLRTEPHYRKKWKFCFKDDDGVFGEIKLPQGWNLDVNNGEIHVPTIGVTFAPYKYPWPYQVQKPDMCLSIALLEKLLKGGKTNPITILLQSQQPYKGLAAQIIEQLFPIVDGLTKRPDWKFDS